VAGAGDCQADHRGVMVLRRERRGRAREGAVRSAQWAPTGRACATV
jgi:hypothetical protein